MNILFLEESNYQSFEKKPLVIGGLIVDKDNIAKVNKEIKRIKAKHGIKPLTEVKWTKVGKSKIQAYIDLIDFALESDLIKIRALVAKDKTNIELSYKDWYTRLHYTLLSKSPFKINGVISDKKGDGFEQDLAKTIEMSLLEAPIKQFVNSRDSQIVQLSDIFLGAISASNSEVVSPWKKALVDHIKSKMDISSTTPLLTKQNKYNIFYWVGR